MVDLGKNPFTSKSIESFDRTRYPVRYYYTDLSQAKRFDDSSSYEFQRDVEDLGGMLHQLLVEVNFRRFEYHKY